MTDIVPPPEDGVRNDFLAGRAQAARGDVDAAFQRLLPGAQAAPAAGAPSSPAPAPQNDAQPLGLRLDQALAGTGAAGAEAERTLPDRMRDLVKSWPVPESGPSLIGMGQSTIRGFADLLEYTHGDVPAGQDISDDAKGALALLATPSPASGTGKAIAGAAGARTVGDVRALAEETAAETPAGAAGAAEGEPGAGAAAEGVKAPEASPAVEGGPEAKPAEGEAPEKPAAAPYTIGGKPPTAPVTAEIRQQATDYLEGMHGQNPVQASLEQIADPKVMTDAITRVASFLERGEVKPDDALRLAAYQLGQQPEQLLGSLRIGGKLPTDTEIAAFAMLVNSGAKELWGAAQDALELGTPAAWEKAVRAFALQNQIVGEWSGAGSEMGRAFRARQLASQASPDASRMIQDILAQAGPQDVEAAIRKIASLPTPEAQSGFVGSLRQMGTRDGLLYGWYNYLLGPKTVVKKAATDMLMPVWNLGVRYTAEKFGSGAVAPGETMQLLQGYLGATGDALQAAKRGLMAGQSQFLSSFQTMDGLAKTRLGALANGMPETLPAEQPTLSAINYLRAALPTSWIAGLDDAAKVFNYRAELRSLAYREGMAKFVDADGSADIAAVSQHVDTVMTSPPPSLHEQAVNAALKTTFQEPLTGAAASLGDWADKFNWPVRGSSVEIPVGRLIMPFFKTPANFVKFMYNQSPLPAAFPSAAFRQDTMFPGAARDLAFARVGLGTALSLAAGGLAAAGYITGRGPSDPNLRKAWLAAGNQPYSVQVPGQRPIAMPIEPFGMQIGAIADTMDLLKFAKPQDADQLALSLVLGTGHAFLSRTYMSGIADFFDAIQHPDTQGARWADNLVASLTVPRLASDVAGAVDPTVRAHYDFMATVEAKLPFLSRNLPAARTQWGDPVQLKDSYLPFFGSGTGLAHVVSPFTLGPSGDQVQPIDKWIWEHRADFPASDEGRIGFAKPGQTQSWEAPETRGVSAHAELAPEQLDRLQELAGNGVKDRRGLGAKDTLNALVEGRHPDAGMQGQWDAGSDGARAIMALSVFNKSKEQAKQQLLGEFPELSAAVQAQWTAKRQALTAPSIR